MTTSQNKEAKGEKQVPTGAETRLRIYGMQLCGEYPTLEQKYLAKKLNRSEPAIVFALDGKSPKLLRRINKHLDWLIAQKAKKKSSPRKEAA